MKEIKLYGGIKPYVWQTEVHNYITDLINKGDTAKIIVVKAARQVYGKSAMTKAELLRFSLRKRNKISAYISPTLKLAKKMYDEIVKECDSIIKAKNGTDLAITFMNDSKISFFSAEQRDNLRGFTVTGIMVIDEACVIPDDIYNELLSPWVEVHKALTLITSTPKYKIGFFYELFKAGLDKYSNIYKTFDWSGDYPVDETTERMLDKKDKLPRQKYRSEYVGEFLDGDGATFSEFTHLIENNTEFEELYLGLDFGTGSGKDETVLTGINEDGKQVLQWSTNSLDPLKQCDEITKILKENKDKIKKLTLELNSIGKIYYDILRKQNPNINIEGFTTTNDSKRKLVEDLQVAIQNCKIRILDDKELHTQLTFYEPTINKDTNKISYNAPKGLHDDKVIALMLAWRAYLNKFNNYRFTIL